MQRADSLIVEGSTGINVEEEENNPWIWASVTGSQPDSLQVVACFSRGSVKLRRLHGAELDLGTFFSDELKKRRKRNETSCGVGFLSILLVSPV